MANIQRLKISIVVPLFNEAELIQPLFTELAKLSPDLSLNSEVILVNDGSTDSTVAKIKALTLPFKKRIVSFSRNFGHQAAILAGIERAEGDIVITMDGDLQHPPALIPEMLKAHGKGIDVVFTQRTDQGTTGFLKRGTSNLFYALINSVSPTQIPPQSSDFRSMSRKAVNALLSMPEKRKFLRGMVVWIGFPSITLPFKVQPRYSGKSKYTLRKMLELSFFGITSFSTAPLYLAGLFSVGLFSLAFLYSLYVLYVRFLTDQVVSGWASVIIVLLVIGGCLSLFLGLFGIYLAAIYEEVKNRPIYIVDSESNE